jgi:hypothetical protein
MANVLTRTGKSIISNRIKGESTEPNVVAWGLNPAELTATNTDIALFSESAESRVAGTSSFTTTTFVNDTYQVIGTQTASAERKIREVALTNSTTKPFSTTVEAGSGVIGSNSSTELKVAANYTPVNKTYIQIRGEVLKVESGEGTKNLTVQRGQNGSTASSALAAADVVTLGNIPGPFSTGTTAPTTGASLFTHSDLAVVSLNSGDSIQWTWTIQFS